MNINIKATNIELTEDIKNYLEKRLGHVQKVLPESEDREILIDAEVGKETNHHRHGNIFFVKIRCEYSGDFYYAETLREDIMSAIDEVDEELVREINSSEEKKQDLTRKKAAEFKDQVRGLEEEV